VKQFDIYPACECVAVLEATIELQQLTPETFTEQQRQLFVNNMAASLRIVASRVRMTVLVKYGPLTREKKAVGNSRNVLESPVFQCRLARARAVKQDT